MARWQSAIATAACTMLAPRVPAAHMRVVDFLAVSGGTVRQRGLGSRHALAGRVDACSCLARALGFLYKHKRKPVQWRPSSPKLVAWLAASGRHEPAFGRTKAPAA